MRNYFKFISVLICSVCLNTATFAANTTLNLEISYKDVNFTGQQARAIAVNGQIPGPTLRFNEGDAVTINVQNKLDKGTAIHWHGVLVPWQMDGVDGVSQQAIPPGTSFTYKFSVQQAGTYWYHSHAGLQEQQGLYGAIIIEPKNKPAYKYNQDAEIVLSDWSNTPPEKIMANLKNNGQFYSMQHAMYDYSDVVYDAFLLNGKTKDNPWTKQVKVGDIVRLRFIGAGASTIFRVKVLPGNMHVVQVQGNDVTTFSSTEVIVAPGETQDVLVNITNDQPYIIYAESMDKVGAVYGALLTASQQKVDYKNVKSFAPPNPGLLAIKYQNVVAAVPTNDPSIPVKFDLKMELTGNMNPYTWSINDVTGYDTKPIMLRQNSRYRITFTNSSMMPHPMHIHGHWFILRKGQGNFDPLLHTVVVAPQETVTVDVDADASGQWIFHCHMLYHMHAGMWRVFQYDSLRKVVEGQRPQDMVQQTQYINRPIVRVDEARPIDIALVDHPEPK